MAIVNVWIDEDCTVCGVCESICPEVFEIVDTCEVREGVNFPDYDADIREAAENCPVEVIMIEED